MDIETLTLREIKNYIKVLEKLAEDRDALLAAIPECPMHGPCMPHALEWIRKQKGKMSKSEYMQAWENEEIKPGDEVVMRLIERDADYTVFTRVPSWENWQAYQESEKALSEAIEKEQENG